MEKRIVKQGHSYALIIDIPMRKVLKMGPSRIVDIKQTGNRLIIEAVPEATIEARAKQAEADALATTVNMDAGPLIRTLIDDVSVEELRKLHPRFTGSRTVDLLFVDIRALPDLDAVILRTRVFFEEIAACGRERALEIALASVPYRDSETIPLTA